MVRFASCSDMYEVRNLWKDRFKDSDEFLDFFFHYRAKPEYTVVFDENDHICSALQIHPVSIRLRNLIVPSAILCGVSTSIKHEGKGYMRACLEFAINNLASSEYAVIIQKPADFAIYESFGFSAVNDSIYFKTNHHDNSSFGKNIEPSDHLSELSQIYSIFTSSYSGSVVRDIEGFSIKAKDLLCDDGSCFAVFDQQDKIRAYAFIEKTSNIFNIRECAFDSIETGHRLLNALSNEAYLLNSSLSGRIPCCMNEILPLYSSACLKPTCAASAANISLLLKYAFNDKNICVEVYNSRISSHCGRWLLNGDKSNCEPDIRIDSSSLIQLSFGYKSLNSLIIENKVDIFNQKIVNDFDMRFPVQQCFCWDEY